MCFNVSFINNHESVLVTQLIEIRSIWIMATSNGIEVMLFHHCKICHKLFHADCKTCNRIRIMTINTSKLDILSVEIDNLINNLDCSETYILNDCFIFSFKNQCVKIWIFCIPKNRIFNF